MIRNTELARESVMKFIVGVLMMMVGAAAIVSHIEFWPFGFIILCVLSLAYCIGMAIIHTAEES